MCCATFDGLLALYVWYLYAYVFDIAINIIITFRAGTKVQKLWTFFLSLLTQARLIYSNKASFKVFITAKISSPMIYGIVPWETQSANSSTIGDAKPPSSTVSTRVCCLHVLKFLSLRVTLIIPSFFRSANKIVRYLIRIMSLELRHPQQQTHLTSPTSPSHCNCVTTLPIYCNGSRTTFAAASPS